MNPLGAGRIGTIKQAATPCVSAACLALALFIALGLLFAPERARAASAGKIIGHVVNKQTGEALPSANILVAGTQLGASSDPEGDFVIANVGAGTYNLTARLMGYKEMTITGVRVREESTTEIQFMLEETTLEAKPVVISATRPLVQKDNTASRTVLETTEIVSRPVASITQVITSVPSVNIENGQLLIRGRPLSEVSVLVDGTRARNPLTQTSYLNNISLSAIQEMDIITGSFNAEYGEAQSGVFKITTKEGGEKYQVYLETRFTPPGKKHWGPGLYDTQTAFYWENTHARHLQWWIDYPDQWTDPSGLKGSDPRSVWTPEDAYRNYLATHKALNDYTNTPGYKLEGSLSGPVPTIEGMHFFFSANYESIAPLLGNSYLDHGEFLNASGKISYVPGPGMKLVIAGTYNNTKTAWGVTDPLTIYSLDSRYAYYDFDGLPKFQYTSQSVKFSHALTPESMYEIQFSRSHTLESMDPFPNDPLGWAASGPARDNVLAVDTAGNPIIGAYQAIIGFNTLGYYSRHHDSNNEWRLSGYYSNQLTKNWELKSGFEGTLFNLDHYNHAKSPERTDARVYKPYQGALYTDNKLEFGGLILNAGLRYDFYNPNDVVYLDLFSPLNGPTEKTKLYTQLSPRLGIAHPIDEKTVLHFSYGHFFQAPPFGDYGELYTTYGSMTTMIDDEYGTITALGNRNLRPQKTVAYEVGIERNFFDDYVVQVTGYYKDITNTIRSIAVQTPLGLYHTSGNGDYADVRGVEFSLRKLPSDFFWGYANYTMRKGINGKSGAPSTVSPDGYSVTESGDIIEYFNDVFKASAVLQTPRESDFFGGVFNGILLSVDYKAVFPNSHIPSDVFSYNGAHVRPVEQNTDMRLTKELRLMQNSLGLSVYAEVHNVFNNKHINVGLFNMASSADKEAFVTSGFTRTPAADANGTPYLEMAKYKNLPRSIVFGATVEF